MGMLPPEVFAMILSYVQDDRKVLRAMNAMCKVSRLEVQPLLWRDIEVSPAPNYSWPCDGHDGAPRLQLCLHPPPIDWYGLLGAHPGL